MHNHPITLAETLPPVACHATVNRLWETLIAFGMPADAKPSQCMQAVPRQQDIREQYRAWLVECLYTGLTTGERDILLRAYVQARGYQQRLRGMSDEPGAWLCDCIDSLQQRVELHFLRGE